jgi:hypothetical protein
LGAPRCAVPNREGLYAVENNPSLDIPIYVATENIGGFRKLLAAAGLDQAERAKLLGLLAIKKPDFSC